MIRTKTLKGLGGIEYEVAWDGEMVWVNDQGVKCVARCSSLFAEIHQRDDIVTISPNHGTGRQRIRTTGLSIVGYQMWANEVEDRFGIRVPKRSAPSWAV